MPEAPPWSPGHVGHTPQHVGETLRRSRLAGILSCNLIAEYGGKGPIFASQSFRQPQRFKARSTMEALIAADQYARRTKHAGRRQPTPRDFAEGLDVSRATLR